MTLHRLSWRYTLQYLRLDLPVTLALIMILATSTFLVSGGVLITERHQATVDRLFAAAMPPDLVQLHSGTYDPGVLETFAAGRQDISSWQVSHLAGFVGADLSIHHTATAQSTDLSASLIDHLFVTQNPHFDYLLDEHHNIPVPQPGQVYVPVALAADYQIVPGDELRVATSTGDVVLTVQDVIVDAQMGSSMASASRFLVHASDHVALLEADNATPEVMISYRLQDNASIQEFQRAYRSHTGTPQQGQAVTEVMIRLVTVISEGLVAALGVMAGVFLTLIGLVNIRFVIRSTIAQDHREIGTLRAIGLPRRTITCLYMPRFLVIASAASIVGVMTSVFVIPGVLDAGDVSWRTILWPVVAAFVLWASLLTGCAVLLFSALRSPVSELFAPRIPRYVRRRSQRLRLAGATGWRVNIRYTVATLRHDWRHWLALPVVFGLGTVLCVIPAALSTTVQHPGVVQYLGSPTVDLRLDVQATGAVAQELVQELHNDPRVTTVSTYSQQRIPATSPTDHTVLETQVGNFSATDLAFVTGGPPEDGELALSVLNAERLRVDTGETVHLGQDRTPVKV